MGLSTGGAAAQLVVMSGDGDATFSAPQPVGSGLESPLGVGDVTGDGVIDIVARSGSAAALAAGNGDGTFAAPVPLAITLGAPGAVTIHTDAGAGTAPVWLRLTRSGSTITAAWSPDGSSWFDVDSDTLAIGSAPVLVGLALTSHDDAALATATFDQVVVTP